MSREEALANMRAGLVPLSSPDGSIQIQGVDVQGRAANQLLQAYIQPLFNATNVSELTDAINQVQISLMSLGIFKDVAVSINADKVVTIVLPAANKFVARVGTNVGQSEGSGYIRGSVCNASGWGEIITADTSTGTRTKSSHFLNVSVPVPSAAMVGWKTECLAYSSQKILEWASSRAHVSGMTLRVNKEASFSFGIDAVMRVLKSERPYINPAIRADAGTNLKLSAFLNWKRDTRVPHILIPGSGCGYLLDVRNELALPQSDYPYLKTSTSFHSSFPIWRSVVGSLNAKGGLLFPLAGKHGRKSHLLDRFNLGGPLDLRGFRLNHAGPHDMGNALGGDYLAAVGFSVFAPLPRVESPNLRFHSFVNSGVLGSFETARAFLPSVTSGFGIIYTHPSARFELNIAMPLVAHQDELVHKGLQFGVGLEFM